MKALILAMFLAGMVKMGRAQDDGGVSYDTRGQELLESLDVPLLPGAPFSLLLATEWSRPMGNGGTYTVVNSRPLRRDSAGRLYQERWLLVPKGSKLVSQMSWIQIADPVAKTLLECQARTKACYLENLRGGPDVVAHPENAVTGPLKGDRGTHLHEDLGAQMFAGVPVHGYRETTTLKPGVMGNDLPLVTVREFRFSAALGMNLSSVLDTPRLGKQVFTVTEVATTEPDPRWFQTPEGYQVVDKRKTTVGLK